MTFLELAKKRYSVRAYLPKPVEKEKVQAILEAGNVAPTGCNYQPQRLLVIQSPEGMTKLAEATRTFGAPMAIVVCCDMEEAWTRPYDQKKLTDIDPTIVTDHMMLAATEQGLGTVWLCMFKPEVIKAVFDLPAGVEPINILLVGYADTEAEPAKAPERHSEHRKALSETVRYY